MGVIAWILLGLFAGAIELTFLFLSGLWATNLPASSPWAPLAMTTMATALV